jgi:nitrogen fixation protein NifQ
MDRPLLSDLAIRRAAILAQAADPEDPDAVVFASVLAAREGEGRGDPAEALGVGPDDATALIRRFFPTLPRPPAIERVAETSLAARVLEDEMTELRALLLDHRSSGDIATDWMAAAVARTCLFRDHLWQDLGLSRRAELSALMLRHFRPLADKNTGDMKWKKFFYKQLCERTGLNLCKAPSCGVCSDKPLCFGPEE